MPIAARTFVGLTLIGVMLVAQRGYADEPVSPTSKDASGKSRTFGSGHIQISTYMADLFYVVDNNIFLCTPIEGPRTQGTVLAVLASADQTWSVNALPLSNGVRTVQYPVFAHLRTSNGESRVLFPATLTVKIDIQAGEVLHSNDPLSFD